MGDWNEWEDMKDTIVNEHKYLSQSEKNMSTNKDELLDHPNKYVYTRIDDDNIKRKITMYSSNYVSGWAINAITNTTYNIRIGSNHEQYLFTVRFTARSFKGRENDIITLYYDSPYLYERHHYVSLNPALINKWQTRVNKLPRKHIQTYKEPSHDNIQSSQDVSIIVK